MNRVTLAVAGGRKTQSVVDECVQAGEGRRILIVTYTQLNQQELAARLAIHRPLVAQVDIQGWFSFLMGQWVRPYLPLVFPGRRLQGLNFEGDPGRFASGERRWLDSEGRAYKRHLAHLAVDASAASRGAVIDRLSRIYGAIYIDEVQDLVGYDLEVLRELLCAPLDLYMVGDVRQALIATNIQDPKNSQYKGVKIVKWFEEQAKRGLLTMTREYTTWRCSQAVASFADTIFDASWKFPATVSRSLTTSEHQGVFAVAPEHVAEYMRRFRPLCLRHSVSSAKNLELPFENIGAVKGAGADHVLIGPTAGMLEFLRSSTYQGETPSCSLYVAVTRARSSVAFVGSAPEDLKLPIWTP